MKKFNVSHNTYKNFKEIENYILFSCAGIDYECVDEELYMLTD